MAILPTVSCANGVVTANPAVGRMADRMVDLGASVILTETTEMIGTSHILARRARTPEVSERIKTLVAPQWEKCEQIGRAHV